MQPTPFIARAQGSAQAPAHENAQGAVPVQATFFDSVERAMGHIRAIAALDAAPTPLLGAFQVGANAQDPNQVAVKSERLDHLSGAVADLGAAVRSLAQPQTFATVVAQKGAAEAARYGAALGAAATTIVCSL